MANNTGYKINPILKKVTDDVNEFPLDVNNALVSESGLPQATMNTPFDDPRYMQEDYDACPLGNVADFRYTTNFGNNPFTQVGFNLKRNGTEIVVQAAETTNNFNNVFAKGDEITFINTSLPDNFPWAVNSNSRMVIKVNNITVFDQISSPQAVTMQQFVLETNFTTNKIEVLVTGQSTAVGQLTRTIDTFLFYSPANKLKLRISDNTDGLDKLRIDPVIQGNRLRYNILNDDNNITVYIENTTANPAYIYLEGESYTHSQTVPANSTITINNVPKGGNTYLFDLELDGYVRRADFQKNNCTTGTGNFVPFAKAYVSEAAANADTANFNTLGQQRANTFGACV